MAHPKFSFLPASGVRPSSRWVIIKGKTASRRPAHMQADPLELAN